MRRHENYLLILALSTANPPYTYRSTAHRDALTGTSSALNCILINFANSYYLYMLQFTKPPIPLTFKALPRGPPVHITFWFMFSKNHLLINV